MNKILVACAALLLTSCIQVDDFGDYWDKATIDPSLTGKWERVADADDPKPTGQSWTFTVKDGAYEVQTFLHGKADEDGPITPIKIINIPPYTFLAKGTGPGTILRYEKKGDTITFFVLEPEAEWAYIEKNFPHQTSFYRGDPDEPEDDNPENAGDPVRIATLNDEATKILVSIPNTDHFWDPDTVVKRAK